MQSSEVVLSGRTPQNGAVIKAESRPGGLAAPVMELTGHSGEVFAARFDPSGDYVASGSMDRKIMLWKAAEQCTNFGVLSGHKGAILDLHWARDSRTIFSASADALVASWDLETGERIRRHMGHDDVINAIDVKKRGEEIIVSASDDCTVGIWDPRQKEAIDYFETELPVTAVAISEAGNEIFTGSLDNEIRVWELRKRGIVYSMKGHTDTITSLAIAPDAQALLSNSLDSTIRTWDIRPFAPADRAQKTYDGAPSGLEKNLYRASWDRTGERIIAGSGDRTAVIWETRTGKLLHKLPGHRGAVNDARISPTNNSLVLTASTDQNVILGEIER